MKSVYSAVRTGSLNKAVCASFLYGLALSQLLVLCIYIYIYIYKIVEYNAGICYLIKDLENRVVIKHGIIK
jgi:hypothetical protein